MILSHIPLPDKQIPEGYVNVHGHIHDKSLNECVYIAEDGSIEKDYPEKLYTPKLHICTSIDVTNFYPVSLTWVENKIMEEWLRKILA